ncbi:outer membrane beta-barrel protein [Pseudozobellia thermophila]|uniref:Outer membrane protein beta-barrel domain-containing protein n=1 Tax=Pseudozobellia thermophila TaxID=192903 RepID=A0A1M6BRZ9_9FLAO|nr:outer membrane beta-barrel protein [Pseudozobellia thermophila]SHI51486.1 Outer membrane protein beta-barrel domain-containing protein [Pseudozobellia thermophila]
MGRQHLDELFREKLKDFEETPDERVWDNIEASLNERKKKRALPLWWKLGGAAALLALALFVFNPLTGNKNNIPTVTETESEHPQKENEVLPLEQRNQSITEGDKNTSEPATWGTEEESGFEATATSIAGHNDQGALDTEDGSPSQRSPKAVDSESLAETNANKVGTAQNAPLHDSTPSVAQNDEVDNYASPTEETSIGFEEENKKNTLGAEPDHTQRKGAPVIDTKEGLAQKEADPILEQDPSEKKSILDVIEEQNEKEEALAESSQKRWSVGPSIAPVYFNGVGEGSPIHSAFNQNSKSGNTNLSYGLSVAYEISDKLRLRSGIHKVNYGYDTDDVAFTSTLEVSSTEKIKNINYTSTAKNLIVNSETSTFSSLSSPLNELALEVGDASAPIRNGSMSQHLGYIEVPLELDYVLVDNKFGVNLVGGVSSLFLLDNSVTLSSGDLVTEVGEANNVNNVNFSTNIGFGLNYKFTPSVQFNVEPVFKYQLNTFSEISGDFRPFSVGVYSGLNFKF